MFLHQQFFGWNRQFFEGLVLVVWGPSFGMISKLT